MKLPDAVDRITLGERLPEQPYPPPGFLPFAEGDLGNGDGWGLYWPVGREDREPIVALSSHDDWTLLPEFSSLDAFLAAWEIADEDDDWIEGPNLDEDPASPTALREAAREAFKRQDFDGALELLEGAVDRLPEFTDALIPLWNEYRRRGRREDAVETALQAIRSGFCFGPPAERPLNWLAKQEELPERFADDPLCLQRHRLHLDFGGTKLNPAYPILDEAISVYGEQGRFVEAVTLLQTYGMLMWSETVSFQERYGFTLAGHASRFDALIEAAGLPDRRSA